MYVEGLKDFPSLSVEQYDIYMLFSAVVNALYMLKFSSYRFSTVPFAISSPSFFRYSLSSSLKKPSSLFTLGNCPSFTPIKNTVFTL